jgi:large subunit ribosomal protein L9
MEVILREDVEKLGSRGQIVKVADGYARNFLLPRRMAVMATESNRKIVEQEREAHLRKEAKLADEASELAKLMERVSITITQRAGEEGQLFGSVTAQDIVSELEKQNFTVERRKVQLDHPIRQVGDYRVPIRLHREVTVEIPVTVAAEQSE